MFSRLFGILVVLMALQGACRIEHGTRREAIQMLDKAVALYQQSGLEALKSAAEDPANETFHDRDLYVFVVDDAGRFVVHGANPRLDGKNLMKLKDQNGVEIIRSFIDVSNTKGAGWVDYMWQHPMTRRLQPKSAYVKKLDDEILIGAGIYLNLY